MVKLSDREKEVIELVSSGFVNKEIAQKLSISDKTVQTYVTRVYLKFGVRNRTAAAIKYLKIYKPRRRNDREKLSVV